MQHVAERGEVSCRLGQTNCFLLICHPAGNRKAHGNLALCSTLQRVALGVCWPVSKVGWCFELNAWPSVGAPPSCQLKAPSSRSGPTSRPAPQACCIHVCLHALTPPTPKDDMTQRAQRGVKVWCCLIFAYACDCDGCMYFVLHMTRWLAVTSSVPDCRAELEGRHQ